MLHITGQKRQEKLKVFPHLRRHRAFKPLQEAMLRGSLLHRTRLKYLQVYCGLKGRWISSFQLGVRTHNHSWTWVSASTAFPLSHLPVLGSTMAHAQGTLRPAASFYSETELVRKGSTCVNWETALAAYSATLENSSSVSGIAPKSKGPQVYVSPSQKTKPSFYSVGSAHCKTLQLT